MATSGKLQSRKMNRTGPDVHTIEECNHKLNGKFIHHRPLKAIEDKQPFDVYEYDMKRRQVFVKSKNPIDNPGIIPESEYRRLLNQAHVVTVQEKLKRSQEANDKKLKLLEESQKRKDQFSEAQVKQISVPGSKLDAVESEAAQKNLYLLRRSMDLIIEQDEKVKVANGVILGTKCRAIRNEQLKEKEVMKKQHLEEEQRLDLMMEQQRQRAIAEEEKKMENERTKIQRHVFQIKQQMKEREIERLMEQERIDEESRMINKALIELQKQEQAKLMETKEKQKKMRDEFQKANMEAEHFKHLRAEEQRIAELRVQEYMRRKIEHEEQLAKEKEELRIAKEKEIARMREQQERAKDQQAELDELNALRTQEEKEKEWREKEKLEALKRKEKMEELIEARKKQIEDIRMAQAQYIMKDEDDFRKVAKVQRELHEKNLTEIAKKRQAALQHRKELLKQINEKEKDRIVHQQEKFEEGKAQMLEFAVKDRNVEDYIKRKVEKLRETQFSEQYIKDIERILKTK